MAITIESPRAKTALAAAGLLGPAGAGASTWKTPAGTTLVCIVEFERLDQEDEDDGDL